MLEELLKKADPHIGVHYSSQCHMIPPVLVKESLDQTYLSLLCNINIHNLLPKLTKLSSSLQKRQKDGQSFLIIILYRYKAAKCSGASAAEKMSPARHASPQQ